MIQSRLPKHECEQSPSWKANSHPAGQAIPFMEREGSLLCSQQPETGPYPEPHASSPQPRIPFI
jgi:hypothetical protein